jgi:hypothetical protein
MTVMTLAALNLGAVQLMGPDIRIERGFFTSIPPAAWSAFAQAIG